MKSLPTTIDLAQLLKKFFFSYLINQRRVSKHTVSSYKDTFRLLLPFIATQLKKPVSELSLVDINAEAVISFLQHLETHRKNKVKTRNARLAAIHSFFNYAATQEPAALADIQPVLAIPEKRTDRFLFEYLDNIEMTALLKVPNLATWFGRRDHALLLTLYNTGARVSEIVNVKIKDVDLRRQHAIHLHGKGRKERIVPLWPQTVTELNAWLIDLKPDVNSALFPNRYGESITRFGVNQRLKTIVKSASIECLTLKGRKISPHSIRHSTAMNLLQSGVDLTVIALWLGHEKIETTHQYMEANLEMKRKALESLPLIGELPITSSNGASEDILTFLESL